MVGKSGKRGDQGGHIIACIFGGTGQSINMVPMCRSLNLSAWKKLENRWAKALKAGSRVYVVVDLKYEKSSSSRRLCGLTARWSVDGGCTEIKEFTN